jgi:hypothetical protein
MNLPLVFGPPVQHDVDSAYEWYEKERPGLGERLLAAIRAALARVQTDLGWQRGGLVAQTASRKR